MGNIFAASEVVELGIQIEKNGRDFYQTLKERAKSKEVADTFKFLAQEEERHIAVFEGILNKIEKYEPAEAYPGEYFAYMNALAGEYIFTQKNKGVAIAKEMSGEREAINMGVGFEKDSIIFYEGMKKIVPEFEQKVVDELIMQEERHLKLLTDLKRGI